MESFLVIGTIVGIIAIGVYYFMHVQRMIDSSDVWLVEKKLTIPFKSRKEFWIGLIPFQSWIMYLVIKYRKLPK